MHTLEKVCMSMPPDDFQYSDQHCAGSTKQGEWQSLPEGLSVGCKVQAGQPLPCSAQNIAEQFAQGDWMQKCNQTVLALTVIDCVAMHGMAD
jgi:hypothetical protein